ncbi:hypothetical protein GXW82_12945 [Streptacidiphilus sp. 4-A2]|nr:hypothetical protein [Streptacidiphilus sp. 4-A2]
MPRAPAYTAAPVGATPYTAAPVGADLPQGPRSADAASASIPSGPAGSSDTPVAGRPGTGPAMRPADGCRKPDGRRRAGAGVPGHARARLLT